MRELIPDRILSWIRLRLEAWLSDFSSFLATLKEQAETVGSNLKAIPVTFVEHSERRERPFTHTGISRRFQIFSSRLP